jgi:hypothetical protein
MWCLVQLLSRENGSYLCSAGFDFGVVVSSSWRLSWGVFFALSGWQRAGLAEARAEDQDLASSSPQPKTAE